MKRKIWAAACLMLACMLASGAALACDHVYGGWWTKRLPTCHLEGLEFKDCKKCDHWEKREIPKLKHVPDAWVKAVEPTCTYRGSEEATCTICGDLMRRFIEVTPHNYGEMKVTKAPTCLGEGSGEYQCVDCGKKKRETLSSLGHDYAVSEAKTPATFKKAGYGVLACTRCSRTKKGEIPRLEHNYTEWQIEKMPKGKTRGIRHCECTLCGKKVTEKFFEEGTLYQDMAACEEVKQLQQMLRDLDYYGGTIRTGTFGANTGKAVAKFQKENGLAATEVADPATLDTIKAVWEIKMGKTIDQLVVEVDK